jgi:two-component system, OmpR family, response regulator
LSLAVEHRRREVVVMRTSATRVLVIDDDRFLLEALAIVLGADGCDVLTQENGLAIEKTVESYRPDLVLLDLKLDQGPDGLALTRRLRSNGDIPVMLVSASTQVEDRVAALTAGADDFLVKPFSMSELRARVGALLRRSNRPLFKVLEIGDIIIDLSAHIATRAGVRLMLRHIEFRLLETFCRHPGQVLSKVQLLETIWGHSFSDVNLVEVHVSHLRRELERVGPRVIHTVRSVGYVLQHDRADGSEAIRPARSRAQ